MGQVYTSNGFSSKCQFKELQAPGGAFPLFLPTLLPAVRTAQLALLGTFGISSKNVQLVSQRGVSDSLTSLSFHTILQDFQNRSYILKPTPLKNKSQTGRTAVAETRLL